MKLFQWPTWRMIFALIGMAYTITVIGGAVVDALAWLTELANTTVNTVKQ